MTEVTQPAVRPARPFFSSGPCAKRPGWTPEALNGALLGRSHRSKPGKAKLKDAIDRTRKLLGIPADYRVGIVPASDTGAVEMAMWSLLGPAPVDLLRLGKLRRRLGHRHRQAAQAQGRARHQGRLRRVARPDAGRSQTTTPCSCGTAPPRGVRVPEWRLDSGRPRRPHHLRRHQRRLRDGPALGQARCRHLLLAEGAGRRSRARHAGAVAPRRGAAGKLHAALADAENLPHDQGRQDRRRHFRRRDHQHAVDAGGGRLSRRPDLGRKRRRSARR